MKTITGKYLTIFILLIASISMSFSAFAKNENNNLDHAALAVHHENVAKEMQAKAEQHKNTLKNKPRSSYFGRNAHRITKRITYRINKHEKAAEENLAKANYHTTIAAQRAGFEAIAQREGFESVAQPGQANDQINKAKKNINGNKSL